MQATISVKMNIDTSDLRSRSRSRSKSAVKGQAVEEPAIKQRLESWQKPVLTKEELAQKLEKASTLKTDVVGQLQSRKQELARRQQEFIQAREQRE